jgi:hypothetical protein
MERFDRAAAEDLVFSAETDRGAPGSTVDSMRGGIEGGDPKMNASAIERATRRGRRAHAQTQTGGPRATGTVLSLSDASALADEPSDSETEIVDKRGEDTSAARGVLLGAAIGGLLWTGLVAVGIAIGASWFD